MREELAFDDCACVRLLADRDGTTSLSRQRQRQRKQTSSTSTNASLQHNRKQEHNTIRAAAKHCAKSDSVEKADVGHRNDKWAFTDYLDACALAVLASRCETTWSTDSADTPYCLMIASCDTHYQKNSNNKSTMVFESKFHSKAEHSPCPNPCPGSAVQFASPRSLASERA